MKITPYQLMKGDVTEIAKEMIRTLAETLTAKFSVAITHLHTNTQGRSSIMKMPPQYSIKVCINLFKHNGGVICFLF